MRRTWRTPRELQAPAKQRLGVRFAAALLAVFVAGCESVPLNEAPPDGLVTVWVREREPSRIHGKSWLVGSSAVNVVLIDSGEGLVLIDGGPAHMAALVEHNLSKIGYSLRDVRLILSSEPHYDHAGALAALVKASGATVLASAEGAKVIEAGMSGPDDPQYRNLHRFPPLRRVRRVVDGEKVRLGTFTATAHAMPGHAPGSMSWSWPSCDAGKCVNLVFAASLSLRNDDRPDFPAAKQKAILTAFRESLTTLRALRCDLVVIPHPRPADSGGAGTAEQDPCDRLAATAEADAARQVANPVDAR